MSAETDEFLQGLYGYDEDNDGGPYVNWTNGFEASADEYENYEAQDSADSGNGGWQAWEKD
ncbi:MAG TPA: hypothetical protein VKY74_12545 [Chloroflexia bacterium]|nr:hypothetical protein [Chloroflexia bacterium]